MLLKIYLKAPECLIVRLYINQSQRFFAAIQGQPTTVHRFINMPLKIG